MLLIEKGFLMTNEPTNSSHMTWLVFVLLTVVFWGIYGVLLHTGQTSMSDPVNGRYKAFLFVGLAYFLTAVLAPLLVLLVNRATWQFPVQGIAWSLLAGIAGAVGAFCVLLAFGARGSPAVVMSIVFAGAPIVNAFVAIALHPPQGGLAALRWPFVLGLIMAAVGGCLVTLYRPQPSTVSPRVATIAEAQRK
jgi:drug/metabolite transporter (DMT)-like permease